MGAENGGAGRPSTMRAWTASRTFTALRARAPAMLVLLGVALLLATRAWHPIAELGNADIAGILYEADIISDGGLPYRDTLDMKSPGSWFLFAAIFAGLGRSIESVQLVYTGWCLLAAPAIWLAARALYGRGLATGAAVLLYLAAIGCFDLNYSAWMATPYAWAFACLLLGLRGRCGWWHLLAGVFAALAVAIKAQAFVLAPCFALVWLWARRRGEPGATPRAWPLWAGGALLGLLPLLLWYQRHDALPLIIAGLFPLGVASDYGAATQRETWWIWGAYQIPLQLVAVYPLHATLSLAALLGARRTPGLPLLPQLLLLALSVVGCGVGGMRFYVHYLPQYLPALALLAAHPQAWSYLRRAWAPEPWRARALSIALATLCTANALALVIQIPRGKATRIDSRGHPRARQAGEYIAARTTPHDTIQVWGWAAWPVYFWADRRAPSPVFKVLGQVTDYNQNGMFSRSETTNFRPGPAADTLLAAFQTAPPAFFVRSAGFFPGVHDDPLDQWPALRKIVTEQYVLRVRFGKLRVHELRTRIPPDELTKLLQAELAKKKKKKRPKKKRPKQPTRQKPRPPKRPPVTP
jgi:hypothetical protein